MHDLATLLSHIPLVEGVAPASTSGTSTLGIIIGGITTVVGGLFTLAGIYISKSRGNNKKAAPEEDPEDPDATTGHPDEDYRKVLRKNSALTLALELRGYDTSKIRTGRESDDVIKH